MLTCLATSSAGGRSEARLSRGAWKLSRGIWKLGRAKGDRPSDGEAAAASGSGGVPAEGGSASTAALPSVTSAAAFAAFPASTACMTELGHNSAWAGLEVS